MTVRLQALPRGAAHPALYRFAIALTDLRCASGAIGLRVSIGSRHAFIACRARDGRMTGTMTAASSYLIRVGLFTREDGRGQRFKDQTYMLGLHTRSW